jgi:hypothetical protein
MYIYKEKGPNDVSSMGDAVQESNTLSSLLLTETKGLLDATNSGQSVHPVALHSGTHAMVSFCSSTS